MARGGGQDQVTRHLAHLAQVIVSFKTAEEASRALEGSQVPGVGGLTSLPRATPSCRGWPWWRPAGGAPRQQAARGLASWLRIDQHWSNKVSNDNFVLFIVPVSESRMTASREDGKINLLVSAFHVSF